MPAEKEPGAFSDASDVLCSGAVLNGRYLIEKELGRGGIGIVYLARDQQLVSRPVVVKVLLEQAYLDHWIRGKFRQEVEALARIDHPGVVGVLDAGQMPDGKPYLVMQFIEGITLRSLIRPEGMDLARTARLMKQIGHALAAAHEKGVLHRDLKPENIMIQNLSEGEEQVKLIDFGLAKVTDSQITASTAMPNVAGSFGYMSPEQLTAKPVTPAGDVYSLGVIAYEMVTGSRAFKPDSMFELYDMQRTGVKAKPKELCPDLPDPAQAVILKALSFEPKDRYQNARDFCEDFARSLIGSFETVPHFHATPAGATHPLPLKGILAVTAWLSLAVNLALITVLFKTSFFRFLSWESYLTQSFIFPPLLLLLAAFVLAPLISFFVKNTRFDYGLFFRKTFTNNSGEICPWRLLSSCLLAAAFGLFLASTPPVIIISSVNAKTENNEKREFTLNYSDPKGYKYTIVDSSYCLIAIDPGRWNRLDDYSVQISLSPHIEFADVYFDKHFGVADQLLLEPSNTNDVLLIRKNDDNFLNKREIKFTYKYRTLHKENKVTVSLRAGDKEIIHEKEIVL